MNKKFIKFILGGLLLFILFLIGLTFSFRNYFLTKIVQTVEQKFASRYNGTLKIGDANFIGLTTVSLSGIILKPIDGDTLVYIDNLSFQPKIWKALKGKLAFTELNIENVFVKILKNEKGDNFSFLLKQKNKQEQQKKLTWSEILYKEFRLLESSLPESFNASTINVNANINEEKDLFIINKCSRKGEIFSAFLNTRAVSNVPLIGKINTEIATYDLSFKSPVKFQIPFLHYFSNSYLSAYSSGISIKEINSSEDKEVVEFFTEGLGLSIFHPRLSSDTLGILNASMSGKFKLEGNNFVLDSNSYLSLNSIKASLKASYRKSPHRLIELCVKTPLIDGNSFFESLPSGAFNNLTGIKTSGQLQYLLNCSINIDHPDDSIKFNSSLIKKDFKILSYGKNDISKINTSFSHTAYEKEIAVKTFLVGPENSEFIPLQNISHYIKDAILTSEDGNFFWHKGFNEWAIEKSIRENIKAGRFVRGASTISMQLVKNVYLTRKKTLSRKLEEMLIVWLIENQRIASKERMLEVYLNIIEFGPKIYGIGPACKFYFGKRPADITLEEAIFISSILPRPKWFMYNFDENGKVKPFIADYYLAVARFLKGKKLITENEFNDLRQGVTLTGIAKTMLKSNRDSSITDSLLVPTFQTRDE